MKKHNFIKRALVALTFAVAVAVMVPAAGSVEAQAATKKTANKNWKKAPSIKLNKTYKVTSKTKGGDTYVKFKATKTANYVFTIYDMKAYKPVAGCDGCHIGRFYIRKPNSRGFLEYQLVKTQGGKTKTLHMATPKMYKQSPDPKNQKGSFLQKRTATLKIKAGETIYIHMSNFTCPNKKCTYMLKVKKK